jgi:hypothetical protein
MYRCPQGSAKVENELISLDSFSLDKAEGEEEVKCDTERGTEEENEAERERERVAEEKAREIKAAKVKALAEASRANDLKKQKDRKKDALKATKEEKKEREYVEEREHAFLNSITDSHHRITKHITKKSYLSQVCCIGSAETQTQATVWADLKTREVGR